MRQEFKRVERLARARPPDQQFQIDGGKLIIDAVAAPGLGEAKRAVEEFPARHALTEVKEGSLRRAARLFKVSKGAVWAKKEKHHL